jgi:hypothetical protein
MATPKDVLAAIEHVKECTGNPKAWLTGLTPQDMTDLATVFAASPRRLDEVLASIRHQHPDLFNLTTGEMVVPPRTGSAGQRPPTPQPGEPAGDRQEGNAADAIRAAEVALAHQNSAAAQLDLQVVAAVLNAHQETAEGRAALNMLQHDIEAAVRIRSDLDTPAGARDFERFLIGKLRDIRAVVTSASLDDTSKSALMAAWTSLYNSSGTDASDANERRPSTGALASPPADGVGQSRPIAPGAATDPNLDLLPADDSGLLPAFQPTPTPAQAPTAPVMPSIPTFGGGAAPGGTPGVAMPSRFPLSGLLQRGDDDPSPRYLSDAASKSHDRTDEPLSERDDGDQVDDKAAQPEAAELPVSGPTTVTLPNGETVTASSPQLAAAIKAAAAGVPIPDAFRQQGIAIPAPGTAVSDPVDPSQVVPGDIGVFTNRHALALGESKALLDGQIQHISTVKGANFLGWEHLPVPASTTAPVRTELPAPTRPATSGRP